MPDEIVHVEVTQVGEEPRPGGAFRRAFWTVLLLAAVFFAVKWWPLLTVVLIAAVLLSALSTQKLARQRALWEARFARPAEGVGISTYVRFLAAWFFGIIVAIPFAFLVLVAIAIGLAIVFVVALLAIVASLFSAE